MPAKTAKTESDGFSADERAAMKERAAELRAEGKKGAKKADGLQAVLDSIAKMAPEDRALAERVHVAVTDTPPSCRRRPGTGCPPMRTRTARSWSSSRTPASSSTGTRRSASRMRPTSTTATCGRWRTRSRVEPKVEKRVVELVKAAIS